MHRIFFRGALGITQEYLHIWLLAHVAHALLRAASTLLSTPGEPGRRSVEKSLDAARRSACATVWSVKLFLRGALALESVRKLPCHLETGVGQVVNLRADWLSAQLARLTIGPQLTKLPHLARHETRARNETWHGYPLTGPKEPRDNKLTKCFEGRNRSLTGCPLGPARSNAHAEPGP